jgi:hypothetical protein
MTLLLLHHKIKKRQIKKFKDTDKLIKHIFNFHLNTRQICCSQRHSFPLSWPLDRKTFGSLGTTRSLRFTRTYVRTMADNQFRPACH